jgi:hypothetical protein
LGPVDATSFGAPATIEELEVIKKETVEYYPYIGLEMLRTATINLRYEPNTAPHVTFQVSKLVLQPELPLISHNLLYEPGLKEA